jgi:hypothetical protein
VTWSARRRVSGLQRVSQWSSSALTSLHLINQVKNVVNSVKPDIGF